VNLVLLGFLGSLAAGMMTTVGALPVLFGRTPSERSRDALLGFAAGVMLSASFFSLIIPSLDISTELYGDGAIPAGIAVIGILLGATMVALINRYMPHEHFIAGREGPDVASLRRIWLFVIAITIHNFPEGLAVGVGFGGDNLTNGV
jgi:ZIP family zinc transporter